MAKPKYMPDPKNIGIGGNFYRGNCPDGRVYDTLIGRCIPVFGNGKEPALHSGEIQLRNRPKYSQESEMLRSKVCGYLKKKIADEEQETQQYHNIELDIRKLYEPRLTSYVIPDIDIAALNTSQAGEVNSLKAIYNKFCVRY